MISHNELHFLYMVGRRFGNFVTMIGLGDIRHIGSNPTLRCQIYELKSPITNEWIRFEISDQWIAWIAHDTGQNPYPREINSILEYYFSMREVLKHARNYSPLNHDLTSLDNEESSMFGVKKPRKCSI